MQSVNRIQIVVMVVVAFTLLFFIFYETNLRKEKEDWLRCIKDTDQLSAQNLVCRKLFPRPYELFESEYLEKGK